MGGGAGGGGGDARAGGGAGEGALARLLEQPFFLESRLQPLELCLECAHSFRLDEVDDELQVAPCLVERDPPVGDDGVAVVELEALVVAFEEDAAKRRVGVLQAEAAVAGRVAPQVLDLAADPEAGRAAVGLYGAT